MAQREFTTVNPNMKPYESDADFCRRNGWQAGQKLAGDEGYGVSVIQLTAIGERSIFAKEVSRAGEPVNESEHLWTLYLRDWKPV